MLWHLAQGETNQAIAAALGITEGTVLRHISNLLGKLDVPSRTAATAKLRRELLLHQR